MISYNIDSLASAMDFVEACEKYQDDFYVQIRCGQQVIDGSSVLGVMSLCGNVVGVEVTEKNSKKKSDKYYDFLKDIGAKK